MGNAASLNHIDKDNARSIKKLFLINHLQPIPIIVKKPIIKAPPSIPDIERLSSERSITTLEENPVEVEITKRPNLQRTHIWKNLFPTMMKRPEQVLRPELKRPTSKTISFGRDSKFIPIPKFFKHKPKPMPFFKKPMPDYEQPKWKPIPEFEKPDSKPTPKEEKPVPEFEKPNSKPTPKIEKPVPEPSPKSSHAGRNPAPEFEKPIPPP